MSEASERQLGREFGQLEAKVEELEKKVDQMQETLEGISRTLSEAAGGWKMLLGVGAVAGAIGAAGTKLLTLLGKP